MFNVLVMCESVEVTKWMRRRLQPNRFKANLRSLLRQWYIIVYVICETCAPQKTIISAAVSTAYAMNHLFPAKVPFINDGTIIGFFAQLLISSYSGSINGKTVIAVVGYFVSCCLFIDACCQDITRMFNEMNELEMAGRCAKNLLGVPK